MLTDALLDVRAVARVGLVLCCTSWGCGAPASARPADAAGQTPSAAAAGRLAAGPAEPAAEGSADAPPSTAVQSGAPPAATLDAALQARSDDWSACLQMRPTEPAFDEGVLRVRLVIELDGSLGGFRVVADSIQRTDVQRCVVETLGALRLDVRPDHPTVVEVPFRLQR